MTCPGPPKIALVLAVALLGSGCEPGDSADDRQALSSANTSANPPVSEAFPSFPSKALLAKVARGDWTLPEGIIRNLEIITGERSVEDVYGEEVVNFHEGGSIVRLARRYLDEGEDKSARGEISRLLNVVTPDIERIEHYTVKAETVLVRRLMQKLVDGWFPQAHAQGPDSICNSLWQAGFPDSEDPSTRCFEKREWGVDGKQVRVYYPNYWTDPGNVKYVNWTQAAINRSLATYPTLGLRFANDINVVFSTLVRSPRECQSAACEAAYQQRGRSNRVMFVDGLARSTPDCQITVFMFDLADDESWAKQLLAHEVFHCFQTWNLSDQEAGPDVAANDWWLEGSAEYFSNLVYPCVDAEHGWVAEFDRVSPEKSLLDMAYETSIFFQFLGNTTSNRYILQLLRSMPDHGGLDEQAEALASYASMPEQFHAFGEHYLAGAVDDSCPGRRVPVNPKPGDELRIRLGQDHQIAANRFVLARRTVAFGTGNFQLAYDPDVAPPRASMRWLPGSDWLPPLERADHQCNDGELQLLLTYVIDDAEAQTYVITEESPPEPDHQLDQCLLGRWEATDESANRILQWIAETRSAEESRTRVDPAGVGGKLGMQVTDTGRLTGWFSDYVQRFDVTKTHSVGSVVDEILNQMDIEVALNGESSADYSADGTRLQIWNVCGEQTATSTVDMHVGDETFSRELNVSLKELRERWPGSLNDLHPPTRDDLNLSTGSPLPDRWDFDYRCRPDGLEISAPAGPAGSPPWHFRRSGSIPAVTPVAADTAATGQCSAEIRGLYEGYQHINRYRDCADDECLSCVERCVPECMCTQPLLQTSGHLSAGASLDECHQYYPDGTRMFEDHQTKCELAYARSGGYPLLEVFAAHCKVRCEVECSGMQAYVFPSDNCADKVSTWSYRYCPE